MPSLVPQIPAFGRQFANKITRDELTHAGVNWIPARWISQVTPVNELARACADSAEAAEWEEFLRRCAPVATMVAARVSRMWLGAATPSIVDDIVQEVFLKLCEHERRILRDFTPRGDDSFFGLLRVISASVANDYFRRQHSEKRGGKVVTVVLDENPASASPRRGCVAGRRRRYAERRSVFRARPDAARGPWTDRRAG